MILTQPQLKIKMKYGEIEVPAIIGECEYINIAKMKTHMQTGSLYVLKIEGPYYV